MYLHELKSPKGARRPKVLRGRGPASGLGKTSGRGENGQRSRTGRGIILGSEGGQMPLIRRLPKVGFNTHNPIVYQLVSVGDLNRFDANTRVDIKALKELKLVSSLRKPVKILSDGELTRPVHVVADKFSSAATAKIEKAGGKAELVAILEVKVKDNKKAKSQK